MRKTSLYFLCSREVSSWVKQQQQQQQCKFKKFELMLSAHKMRGSL